MQVGKYDDVMSNAAGVTSESIPGNPDSRAPGIPGNFSFPIPGNF